MGFINYAAKGKVELAKNMDGNNINTNTSDNSNTQVDVPIITLDEIINQVEIEYIVAPRVANIRSVPRNFELSGIEAAKIDIKYSNYINDNVNDQSMGLSG